MALIALTLMILNANVNVKFSDLLATVNASPATAATLAVLH
jgi:hypothetical protein